MKHIWEQKSQTKFMTYKEKLRTGGKVMTREEKMARFYSIYDKMPVSDRECIEVGMPYVLGGRIGLIFVIGIAIGAAIGAYIWRT